MMSRMLETTSGRTIGRRGLQAQSSTEFLEWVVERAGFRCFFVTGDASGPRSFEGTEFVVQMARDIPVAALLQALQELRSRRGICAVVMTGERAGPRPYREGVELDGASRVVRIRRH